ncbi:8-amino-7-oxononanoate synthase [Alteromonas sp. ASW11-19]|uniref:8-amino-7-ketopelargonate synthase n=1 Tax=Alteromonas salexigens TaxID=2982530 RepID=A0ABT2VS51_9ALTE|nr:8-amino-7-oxononanoate synthase [Alteromonas salexigens]MCU7555253.1 8-amino-7-oxononanoate synthase [Alteromonas salexigens]
MAFDWLGRSLRDRAQEGYLRTRHCQHYEKDAVINIDGDHYLNFASNDYLGMRQNQSVLQAWVEGLAQFGGGSGGSPLVTGYSQAHLALEAWLADKLQREAVLLFNSGFAANQAICQALFASGGDIVADKLMHASFIDGALSSDATLTRFSHNDVTHADKRLHAASHADKLLASEGVFSMDGDTAPVAELSQLAARHDAWFMLDDAHGFGVLGENGLGTAEAAGLAHTDVPVLMATFGKAIGTGGAFIAGSQVLIDYLINHARHYIYSTAMPPAQAIATLSSLTCLEDGSARAALHENIRYFRQRAQECGLSLMDSDSAIQPIVIGDPKRAVAMSEAVRRRGIWVTAMRHPTVPKGTDRLRITLSALHQTQDIDVLCDALMLSAGEVSP